MTSNTKNAPRTSAKSNFGARGWLLVIVCFLTFFLSMCVSGSMNISTGVLAEMKGWNASALYLAFSVGGWLSVITSAAVGSVILKASPRKLGIVFGIIFAIAFGLWGFCSQLWQSFIITIILKICVDAWSFMANNTLVANWFPRKRGLVMGWTTFGMPLGSGIGGVIFGQLVGKIGFAQAYIPFAVAALVLVVLYAVAIRDYPEEVGCFPDNDKSITREQLDAENQKIRELTAKSPWTIGRVLSTKETWLIVLSTGFMMFTTGFMGQIIPTLASLGVAPTFYAPIMMGVAIFACVGSYFCGVLDVKVGSRWAIFITCIFVALMALFAQVNNLPCAIISFACLAITIGGGSNYLVSVCMQHWGRAGFGRAYRIIQPLNLALSCSGTVVISWVANLAGGNYKVSFLVVGALGILGAIMILFVKDGAVQKKEASFSK